ncbi:hypothetical protein BDR04DRAFT_1091605 [Suillus decipiens]|nr:hypothetical protein BDR04DRAFT_1091605 [Suillus decipiens]
MVELDTTAVPIIGYFLMSSFIVWKRLRRMLLITDQCDRDRCHGLGSMVDWRWSYVFECAVERARTAREIKAKLLEREATTPSVDDWLQYSARLRTGFLPLHQDPNLAPAAVLLYLCYLISM